MQSAEIAVLVDDLAAHTPPSSSQSIAYATSRAEAITAQQEASQLNTLEKQREFEEKNREKIEKKRAEKEKKRRDREGKIEVVVPDLKEGEQTTGPPASALASPSSSALSPIPISTPSTASLPPASSLPYTILIEPSSSSLPWYDPSSASATYDTLEAAKDAGLWSYPTSPVQEARCKVFEDLWRRGFYMGGGIRFGGDFLVYPGSSSFLFLQLLDLVLTSPLCSGDPLRYHSHFTLTVLATPTTSIMPLDLVAYGRLATAVKKAHLLAAWNDEKGEAEYASLEWAAFG